MTENKNTLIGLVGYAHHGKSTVAAFLKTLGYIEYAYADPLKEVVMAMFGFTYEQCYDQKLKEVIDPFWGISPRQALIAVGENNAESLKKLMPDLNLGEFDRLWIRRFEQTYAKNGWNTKNIVVSDIRHENEARAIKKLGGYILRIHNPRINMNEAFRSSASEKRVDAIRYDGIIHNDDNLIELYKDIYYMHNAIVSEPLINSSYENYINKDKKLLVLEISKFVERNTVYLDSSTLKHAGKE
jgi:hypothetical protein